jgi:hypothetical protein
VALCGLLTTVYAAAALLYAYVAPLRVPAWSALQSVVAAVLGAVALVDALGEGGALGEASRVRATAALSVVVVVLSGCSPRTCSPSVCWSCACGRIHRSLFAGARTAECPWMLKLVWATPARC